MPCWKHSAETETLQAGGNLVLKSYDTQYESSYQNEIKAYNAFANAKPCENILKYIGSYYVQPLAPGSGLQYTIMLEYAERGSLLQLYSKNDPPFALAETKAFWSSLFPVAKGLMAAHNKLPKIIGASWYVLDFSHTRVLFTNEVLPPVFIKTSNRRTSSFSVVKVALTLSLT